MSAHPEPTPVEDARAAVDAARFPLVAEGYDPHSVDVLLDRLATLLAEPAAVEESVLEDPGSDTTSEPSDATSERSDALRAPRRLTDDDLAFLASLRASVDRPGDEGGASDADRRR